MDISDLKVGDTIISHYDGYYLPKSFSGIRCKIEKIGRKLITISSKGFTGTYKISINNISSVAPK